MDIKMKIAMASDHAGRNLKRDILNCLLTNYEVLDLGIDDATEKGDYPIFAKKLAEKLLNNECEFGILICGTGIGMAITANRFKGIRAANCTNEYMAQMARAHNNANILTLGQRVIGLGLAQNIINVFLNTNFEGQRHQTRVNLIDL